MQAYSFGLIVYVDHFAIAFAQTPNTAELNITDEL